jgi:hypothetical protein
MKTDKKRKNRNEWPLAIVVGIVVLLCFVGGIKAGIRIERRRVEKEQKPAYVAPLSAKCGECNKTDFTANMQHLSDVSLNCPACSGWPVRHEYAHMACLPIERCDCYNGWRGKGPTK